MPHPSAAAVPPRILAIEDDPLLASHLHSHLLQRGFSVILRQQATDILKLVDSQPFDLILMDIMLPDGNGLALLGQLRQRQRVPVILMSALGAEQDRILGFSQGADDYLPKPFSLQEMDVRIDAVLRRVAYEQAARATPDHSDLQLDIDTRRCDVSHAGIWADLSGMEFRILQVLLEHRGEVLSKAFLYQQAMHRAWSLHDRSLDMHVSRIRRKLLAVGYDSHLIETVRGTGYVLSPARP